MKLCRNLAATAIFILIILNPLKANAAWVGYTSITLCDGEVRELVVPGGYRSTGIYVINKFSPNILVSSSSATKYVVKGIDSNENEDPDRLTIYSDSSTSMGGWIITVIDHPGTVEMIDQEPTCSQFGKAHTECTRCGTELSWRNIPTLDHTWDAGTVTSPATLSNDGQITYTCTSCGETKTEAIDRIGKILLSGKKFVYNGTIRRPSVTVKDSKGKVIDASNYLISYSSGGKDAGIYDVNVMFQGRYGGNGVVAYEITRASQKIQTKMDNIKYSAKKIKKKSQKFSLGVSAKTKLSCRSSSKNITVSKKGIVKIAKGTKAGKYKIVIKAAKSRNYKAAQKTIIIQIK